MLHISLIVVDKTTLCDNVLFIVGQGSHLKLELGTGTVRSDSPCLKGQLTFGNAGLNALDENIIAYLEGEFFTFKEEGKNIID